MSIFLGASPPHIPTLQPMLTTRPCISWVGSPPFSAHVHLGLPTSPSLVLPSGKCRIVGKALGLKPLSDISNACEPVVPHL